MMVCDLQGVLTPAARAGKPPMFELTDPVIHYASSTGRRGVYGRTDRGIDGMDSFFRTHKCNGLCDMLRLPPRDQAAPSTSGGRASLGGVAAGGGRKRTPVRMPALRRG
jgi:hypothetical protein